MDFYNLMPLCVNGSPKFMKKYALSRASAAIVSWLLERGICSIEKAVYTTTERPFLLKMFMQRRQRRSLRSNKSSVLSLTGRGRGTGEYTHFT